VAKPVAASNAAKPKLTLKQQAKKVA
jgi:hypothetical protein